MHLPKGAANAFTLSRVLLACVFAVLVLMVDPPEYQWAAVVFVLAAASDSIDGYIARKFNQVTSFGEFLDPLADKLLVGVALVALAIEDRFPWWAVALIFLREALISGLRLRLRSKALSLPANELGKAKTVSQVAAVVIATLAPAQHPAVTFAVVVCVVLTVISGLVYLRPRSRRTVPWG